MALTMVCMGVLAEKQAYAAGPVVVELQTNLGTIAIQPDFVNAPITANNFIAYVDKGFYRNTIIHRGVKNFVIQGGGVDKGSGQFKKPLFPAIMLESDNGLKNLKGTVAMARTNELDSATSQYFINLVDNSFLDYSSTNPGYAVFGKVIRGMNIVSNIGNFITYTNQQLPYASNGSLVWVEAAYKTTLEPTLSRTRIQISGLGTVTSSPAGIDCSPSCSLAKPASGSLSITATAGKGWVFSNWRGDCSGSVKTITLGLQKGNHNCTAVFIPASPAWQ